MIASNKKSIGRDSGIMSSLPIKSRFVGKIDVERANFLGGIFLEYVRMMERVRYKNI